MQLYELDHTSAQQGEDAQLPMLATELEHTSAQQGEDAQLPMRATLMAEFNDTAEREAHYLGTCIRARRYEEGERLGHTLARLLRPTGGAFYISKLQRGDGT
ncbi:hypothetical protein NDU88_012542 [Pleurodeles waltl]|uniref:Uncharacterized protein n=1 Tax=Pleurodeles waltl TaxID=8319 RepID=A0AAV7R0D5_PLEWA|nr:hypothetical protein NDU88_012542 [Pleurodeles waltl]